MQSVDISLQSHPRQSKHRKRNNHIITDRCLFFLCMAFILLLSSQVEGISTLEIDFLFFRNEFREGTYTHQVSDRLRGTKK